MSGRLKRCFSLDDFETEARRVLPRFIHGFISGGSETEAGVRDNRAAFAEYAFVPRALVGVPDRVQSTTLFGREYASPFGVAPMGAAALCGYRAELAMARAAEDAQIPMVLSASSLIALEEVRREHPSGWYQAYVPGDVARIEGVLDRVGRAGYETIVVTADVPVDANRENNLRNDFRLPVVVTPRVVRDCALHPHWFFGTLLRTLWRHGMPHFENMGATRGPPVFSKNLRRDAAKRDELSWEHVAFIRKRWPGKLVIKGILSREDARRAREAGTDGIILSNHGGRQLDGAIAPFRVLPEIVADSGDMPVMMDSGIRRGTDILKALALGARFVFVGRPMLFAAALAGEAGVAHAIALMKAEIDRDLALLGLRDVGQIGPDYVRYIRPRDR